MASKHKLPLRFKTNSDYFAGVERLAIVVNPDSAFLEKPYCELPRLADAGKNT